MPLEVKLSGEEYEKLMKEIKDLRARDTALVAEVGRCLAFITRVAQVPFASGFSSASEPTESFHASYEAKTFIRFFKQSSPVSYDYFIMEKNKNA